MVTGPLGLLDLREVVDAVVVRQVNNISLMAMELVRSRVIGTYEKVLDAKFKRGPGRVLQLFE